MRSESRALPEDWKWFGHAGHFICAQWCRFHLCTQVGDYLISSVGEYVPDEPVREIIARSRGITLEGKGDARLANYLNKIGFEPLGTGPLPYETLVFRVVDGKKCELKECGCGMPQVDFSEVDGKRSLTAGEAAAFHLEMCRKFSQPRAEAVKRARKIRRSDEAEGKV